VGLVERCVCIQLVHVQYNTIQIFSLCMTNAYNTVKENKENEQCSSTHHKNHKNHTSIYSLYCAARARGGPALVAEWAMPLAAVQAGQGSFPVRVEA